MAQSDYQHEIDNYYQHEQCKYQNDYPLSRNWLERQNLEHR